MFEKIVDLFFSPVTQMIITALLGVALAGFKKYKDLYNEIVDIGKKVIEVRKEGSAGGKKITEEEYAAIGKEIVEAIEAASKIDWKSFFKKNK